MLFYFYLTLRTFSNLTESITEMKGAWGAPPLQKLPNLELSQQSAYSSSATAPSDSFDREIFYHIRRALIFVSHESP